MSCLLVSFPDQVKGGWDTQIHRLLSLSEMDASEPRKVKDFDQPLSGNTLQSYWKYSLFVLLVVDLGTTGPLSLHLTIDSIGNRIYELPKGTINRFTYCQCLTGNTQILKPNGDGGYHDRNH